MATQLNHIVTQSIGVKPTVVSLNITACNYGETPKEATDKLLEGKNKLEKSIYDRKSYCEHSYKQSSISVEKLYKSVYNKEKNVYDKIFDKYKASLVINADLEKTPDTMEEIIDDFTYIFNVCIDLEYTCYYLFDVQDSFRKITEQELYAKCIDSGLNQIRFIISKTELKNKTIDLNEVSDVCDSYNNSYKTSKNCEIAFNSNVSDYVPSQYITKELIKELFNNNIEISKTLKLRVSLI